MNADLLTLIILIFSTVLLVVAETHVAFVTFALAGGYVLSDFVGGDIFNWLDNFVDPNAFPLFEAVQLALIFIPAIVIGHRFRRSQRGPTRLVQQIIPAFALSLLVVVFTFNVLPEDAQETLRGESYFHSNLESFRGLLVVFAIAAAMFDILIQHAGPPRKYHKRKKRHKN